MGESQERLNEAMQESGMSATELSKRSGIGKSSISHYINGRHSPSVAHAEKLGKALGVEPEWIMGRSPVKGRQERALLYYFAALSMKERESVVNICRSMAREDKS